MPDQEGNEKSATATTMRGTLLSRGRLLASTDELSAALGHIADTKETASNILDMLGRLVDYRKATVQLVNDGERTLIAYRGFGRDAVDRALLRPLSEDPLMQRVTNAAKPLILSDPMSDSDWQSHPQTEDVRSWIGLPLMYGGRIIALITLDHDVPGTYTEVLSGVLASFADQAALALRQALLFDDAQCRMRDLRILNAIGEIMRARRDTEELLQAIAYQIVTQLDCSHCTVFAPQVVEGEIRLVPLVIEPSSMSQIRTRFFRPGEGLVGWVFEHGQPLLLDDARTDPRYAPARQRAEMPRSMLQVPIKVGDETVAVISADQDQVGWFGPSDLRLLEALARQAGIAIQHSRGLRLLERIGEQVNTAQHIDDILRAIVSGAIKLTDTTSGVIYLLSKDRQKVERSFKFPEDSFHPPPRMDKKDSVTRLVLRHGQVMQFHDIRNDPRVNPALRADTISMIAVPLKHGEQVIGVLYLNDRCTHEFSETEVSLLLNLANQAATALYLDRQVEHQIALNKMGARLTGMQNEMAILKAVARAAYTTFSCTHCSVFRLENGRLVVRAAQGELQHCLQPGYEFGLDRGVAGWVARNRKPALVHRAWNDRRFDRTWSDPPPQSLVVVPIPLEGKVYGVISIEHRDEGVFDDQDLRLLRAFALQVSQAVRSARRIHELQVLNQAGRDISRLLSLEDLAVNLLDTVNATLNCLYSSLFLVQPDGTLAGVTRRGHTERDITELRFQPGEGLVGWVAEHRQALNVPDVDADPRSQPVGVTIPYGRPHSMLLVPMLLQERVVGVLSADKEALHGFGPGDLRLLETLASQAAVAYENARLFEAAELLMKESQQRAKGLFRLQQVSASLMTLELDAMLKLIATVALELTNTESGIILLLSEDGMRIATSVSAPPELSSQCLELLTEGLTHEIVKSHEPVYVVDTGQEPRVSPEIAGLGIKSLVGQPLKVGDEQRVIGVLYLHDASSRTFDEVERKLIDTLASQAAVAIQNARLRQDLERRVRYLDALNEIGNQAGGLTDRQELLDLVVRRAADTLNAEPCILYVMNVEGALVPESTAKFTPRETQGPAYERGQGLVGWVAHHGRAVIVPDSRFPELPAMACPSVAAPLWVEGRVTGVLLAERAQGALFDEADLRFVETLAVQAGIFIRQERLRRQRREAIKRRFNPYVVGQPIANPDQFFGRRRVMQHILDTIHNNNYIVYGEKRIGKTSLLLQIDHRLRALNAHETATYFLPVFASLQGVPEKRFFRFLIEAVRAAAQVPRSQLAYPELPPRYGPQALEDDLDALIRILRRRHPDRDIRIIFLLDEMDGFMGYSEETHGFFRSLFNTRISNSLKMIMAGVTVQRLQQSATSPWYNVFSEEELCALDETEARHLVEDPVAGVYVYEGDALAHLLRMSDLKPIELQRLARNSVGHMLDRIHAGGSRAEDGLPAEASVRVDDVARAVAQVLQEKDPEYREFWSQLDSEQRAILSAAAVGDGLVDVNTPRRAGGRAFSRELLYNVTRIEGHQARLTHLFKHWLEGSAS